MATHAEQLSPPAVPTPTAAAPIAVRISGLTRSFGSRAVLDGIDLDIPAGQFVALLGHSGSGKSTLLRAIAGIDHEVTGDGGLLAPRRMSMVFQDSRLLPWRRVLENVVLGTRGKAALERGRAALAEVGLADRANAWPTQLSGGEAQRAALARSLVWEPELILADEPFGALDALTRIRMHALLRELWERHRPSVLLVTHDVDEAIVLADRVLVLQDGRIGLDLAIEAPHPRSYRDPVLAEYGRRLLAALGVDEAPRTEADGGEANRAGTDRPGTDHDEADGDQPAPPGANEPARRAATPPTDKAPHDAGAVS